MAREEEETQWKKKSNSGKKHTNMIENIGAGI